MDAVPSLPSAAPSASLPSAAPTPAKRTPPPPKPTPCPYCATVLSNPSNMRKHVKSTLACSQEKARREADEARRLANEAQRLQVRCRLCSELVHGKLEHQHLLECRGPQQLVEPDVDLPPFPDEADVLASPSTSSSSSSSSSSSPPVVPPAAIPAEWWASLGGLDTPELRADVDDFLLWLGEAPVSPVDYLLKPRLPTDKAKEEARRHLRFLLLNALGLALLPPLPVHLSALSEKRVVDALLQGKSAPGLGRKEVVGPSRVYELHLVLKKVIGWMCSRQSRQASSYITPDRLPGWHSLHAYGASSSRKRKLMALDRAAFGDGEEPMSGEEMTRLIVGCRADLRRLRADLGTLSGREEWTATFITLLFLLLVGQRSCTISQLGTGTLLAPQSPDNRTDEYVVRISAMEERNKTHKPVLLRLPASVTGVMAFYLRRLLPPDYEGHLFLTRTGRQRTQFTAQTRATTLRVLGREVSPHHIRHSITTWAFSRADVSDNLMRELAEIMSHSVGVQRAHYVRVNRPRVVQQWQGRLMEGVAGGADEADEGW